MEARTIEDLEAAVRSELDRIGLPFEIIPCDPDLADTAVFSEHYGYPMENAGNTIVVASKREPKQYAACVVTATTRLDVNKTVKRLMGVSRLSFAAPEDTVAVTGMMLGGVTVFALPTDLPLYVDRRIMGLDYVILGGGSRSSKIQTSPEVFARMRQAAIIEGLAVDPLA